MKTIDQPAFYPTPTSITHLIDRLKQAGPNANFADRKNIVQQSEVPEEDVRRYIQPVEGNYCRRSIEKNSLFEMLILTWLPSQKSPIHNHKGSQCIVRVLQGLARETVYNTNRFNIFSCSSQDFRSGEVFGGIDEDIHTLENPSTAKECLVTLHIYFPMLENMQIFGAVGNRLYVKIPQ